MRGGGGQAAWKLLGGLQRHCRTAAGAAMGADVKPRRPWHREDLILLL